MLDLMRQKSRSFLIYVLFGMLIIVFIFLFGPQSGGWTPTESLTAAEVGGHVIERSDLEMEFTRHYGWRFASQQDLESVLKQKHQMLEDLIKVHLLARQASQAGLETNPELLRQFILDPKENLDLASFTTDGEFDPELYRRVVTRGYRASLLRYEASRKRELLARRLLQLLAGQVRVSGADVKEAYTTRETKVNLEFVAFAPEDEPEPGPPAEGEAGAWAREHEAEVKAHYDSHKDDFDRPKEVRLRQIFIKASADDEAARTAAQSKAEGLRASIEEGADMAEVAKESSDHVSYRDKGGDMGWQTKGNNDPAFDEVAFGLSQGAVSPVIDTEIGFFIVRAEEVREAQKRSLDDATDEIGATLMQSAKRLDSARARATTLLASVRGGADLAEAVKALNGAPLADGEAAPTTWSVQETGEFTQQGGAGGPDPMNPFSFQRAWDLVPRIGRSAPISRQAFALTTEDPWSAAPVEVQGTVYILRLKDRLDADLAALEDEGTRDALRAELAVKKSEDLLGPWQRSLFGRAFQRRIFGSEPPEGLWLKSALASARKEADVRLEEALFNPAANGPQSPPVGPPKPPTPKPNFP